MPFQFVLQVKFTGLGENEMSSHIGRDTWTIYRYLRANDDIEGRLDMFAVSEEWRSLPIPSTPLSAVDSFHTTSAEAHAEYCC